jgi:Dolichyl-phosphate-mannose-protein mannosyltransferase
LPLLPDFLRFEVAWLVFTFGPGVMIAAWLTPDLDWLSRVVIALGVGSAATPVLIDLLGYAGLVAAFPYLAAAFSGAGLAVWWSSRARAAPISPKDVTACAVLLALCATFGVLVFGHRLGTTPAGIMLYGDYDSADLAYYAAEASEASHTLPPTAAYYSGHKLNAAYYPHLVLAMVHRFADVPILSMYFGFAWPTFLALAALVGYRLVRALTPWPVALLSVVLILAGSDFSYLAAWLLPHGNVDWDFVLWPTNFLSPTMHVLHFNTWGPTMPVFLAGLYAIVRGVQTQSRGWLVLSAFLIAVMFEFKPFAYIVVMAALSAAAVFSGRDWTARWRYVATVALTLVFTVPLILDIFTLDPSDRRSQLVVDFFLLPKRMLIKLGVVESVDALAARWIPVDALRAPLILVCATVVFLLVGTGIRWIGAPGVWRAVRGRVESDSASWRFLGWCVIAGLSIPFVLTTQPYVDTLNFYLTGLYVMWIFTAIALVGFAQRQGTPGRVAAVLAVALTLPSSVHFLGRKWNDAHRPPRAMLSHGEANVATYLKANTDPETTVLLHDRPLAPSLMTVLSERRIVLGWDVRYSAVGGEDRLNDVSFFYASADGDPDRALEILRKYHVTHVLVRRDGNRVQPEVLERLTLLMKSGDVTLYAVPAGLTP